MSSHIGAILLTIILFIPVLSIGQNKDSINTNNEARRLYNEAGKLYVNQNFSLAYDTINLSIALRKSLYGDISPEVGRSYNLLGIICRNLGKPKEAIENFKKAEACFILNEDEEIDRLAVIYNNMGTLYLGSLDYTNALKYYQQALNYFKKAPGDQSENIDDVNFNIAAIYYSTEDYDNAIKLIKDIVNSVNKSTQQSYYDLLANIYLIKKDYSKSRFYREKAIQISIQSNGEYSVEVSNYYLNYSALLISENEFEEAENVLDHALQIIEKLRLKYGPDISTYYLYRGDLFLNKLIQAEDAGNFNRQKRNNILSAIEQYKKGLEALKFPPDYLADKTLTTDNIPFPTECIQLLNKIGDSNAELWHLSDIDQQSVTPPLLIAINTYQLVSDIIQNTRKRITDDAGKIQLTSLEYSMFLSLIRAAHQAYAISNDKTYLELAFQNAERTKGSSVFDKLSDQLAKENSLIPDSLLQLETHYNDTISSLSNAILEESNKAEQDNSLIDDYNSKIFSTRKRREELYSYMEKKYSDYYELKYSNSMISAEEIQQKLLKDQVLIEYVLHERDTLSETDTITELYVFIISSDKIDFIKQNVSPNFISDIEGVFDFISNTDFLFTKNADSKSYCLSAHNLYNDLVKPYLNIIKNKNLTIVPDGKLSYIPFDALLSSLPDTSKMIQFNQLSYLVRDFCINYSISSNLLFKNKHSDHKTGIKTLAFAPEYKNEIIKVGDRSLKLSPLPGVKTEVEQISNILDTKLFEGIEATEANFRSNAGEYDILHLAMHAFINDSVPALSSLVFSQQANTTNNFKELLNTTDIYTLKLNAELTVLSACNTGKGKLLKGEGIMSLARGFLYAGCPSIIMSFWEVEDNSGTKIMSGFYKNLKKGKNKDESLRLAKLEYLESSSSRLAHPHYWLGFVSIGDNSAFFISYDFYFFVLLILALVGIGIDQLIRIKKARNKRALQ